MGVGSRRSLVRTALLVACVLAAAARAEGQTLERSTFLQWVHIDAFWIPASSGEQSLGLVGTHIALAHLGRVYVYSAPGVLLLKQSTDLGWSLRVNLTWGVSVYLVDVRVPGMRRTAQVFLNLAHVGSKGEGYPTEMTGLSVTWKK